MKKIFLAILLALPLAIVAQKPITIPEVAEWTATEGSVQLSGKVVAKHRSLNVAAEQLRSDLSVYCTTDASRNSGKVDVVLSIKNDRQANNEAYTINISSRRVEITSNSAVGVMWGTQTLLQMLESNDPAKVQGATGSLPCGVINDAPQYAMRGFMLDCGRKFFPISYIKGLVRTMSYYKMNTLQLHLNDNGFNYWFGDDWSRTQSAFRLESDYFPGLTATDGHYTKAEIRDLIRYAANLGVEIIPEIDVPAHALAFTKYRPSLAKPEFGMDHLDITNPEVVNFIDSLFTEYLAGPDPVFCCPRVHIGTDEFNNSKPEYREAFRSLTDRLIRLVESYGKQAVAWGSLSHAYGDTPVKSDNVILSMWSNGFARPRDMKEAGYQMISIPDGYVYIVPAAGYYYDYLNCEWLYNSWTPANIGGVQFDEQDPSIIGGMFAVWNDHPGNGITVQDVHDRVFPAMQTLSAKCWSAATTTSTWATFTNSMNILGEAPATNMLGRLIADNNSLDQLLPNLQQATYFPSYNGGQPAIEVGFPYEVSFTVDCRPEALGTVLTSSPNATFYLSDPLRGQVGFEHEGYIHLFNYRLPNEGQVTLTIKADNNSTTLFVDGQQRSRLERETLHVLNKNPHNHVLTLPGSDAIVADATISQRRMFYMHTLFFPLQSTGDFKSTVTGFRVSK